MEHKGQQIIVDDDVIIYIIKTVTKDLMHEVFKLKKESLNAFK